MIHSHLIGPSPAPSAVCSLRPESSFCSWCVQVMKDSAPELNVSSSETEEDKEEAKPDGEKDPDFNQVRTEVLITVSVHSSHVPPAFSACVLFWVPLYLFYTSESLVFIACCS